LNWSDLCRPPDIAIGGLGWLELETTAQTTPADCWSGSAIDREGAISWRGYKMGTALPS